MKQKSKVFDIWRGIALGVSLLTALPLSVILLSFLKKEPEIWGHLLSNVLPGLISNTLLLTTGVLTLTFVLGVGLAWLTALCEYPGRKLFSWALLLPLAVPTYVLAFVYCGLLDYSGPVQTLVRAILPGRSVPFPQIRSAGGVILIMSLALYPYVYILARNAFMTQGKQALEAARSLGTGYRRAFFTVALPMARPWIFGGLMLVLMEALADFGAVSIFNFDTFTTAIYKAWYGFFSLAAAAQLSSILVVIVFVVILLEQKMKARMRYTQSGSPDFSIQRIPLTGRRRWGAFLFSFSVLLAAFVVPFMQLVVWVIEVFGEEFNTRYLEFLSHSLFLGFSAMGVIIFLAVLLAYAERHHKDRVMSLMVRISVLGYALPGTVLAVGMVIVISFFDNLLADHITGGTTVIQGTTTTMILAYMVRFMAAGYNSVGSAMKRITPSIDEAARSLGTGGFSLLARVHVPIMKSGIFTAAMLVFVDVMKEMPITLMTRPFGWDTLAVKIYELTSEGEWERAALPAAALVLSGLIPVIFLTRRGEK